MKTAVARKHIATIHALLVAPKGTAQVDSELFMSIHHLSATADVILSDAELFSEVLELHEAILSYRGKGCQTAALNMSRLLCYLVMLIGDQFPKDEKPDGDLFPTTPKPVPKLEETIWWESIQRLISQAKSFVQGAPSRSQHVSRLRADAWDRLGDMCQIVHDPEIRKLALKTAQNARSTSSERQAAVALLPRFVGEDEPDEEIVNTLDELAAKPTDRSLLRAVLQAQIDLGLESELGAICGLDDWSDAHEDD